MHVLLVGPEFEENLSLRYLAAALQRAGHRWSLARFDSTEHAATVVERVLREQPDIVGLSMVFQVRAIEFLALARDLRVAGYRGHITAGGHFATFACEEILRDVPDIDTIIRQEGEQTLVELADALSARETAEAIGRIPGIVCRDASGAIIIADRRQQVADLDELPFPVRSETPELHLGVRTSFLVGSRGCYADCDYCSIFAWHEAAVGKRYRLRRVDRIVEEMAALYRDRGTRFFVFHDDNFFLPSAAANLKRFRALRAEIERRKLQGIGLMLKLRPNDCDPEVMDELKAMGLIRAFVGIENASQRQMRSLGRDSTVEDVNVCLRRLRELDIYTTFNILLFDPYTTLDDIRENIRFLRENSFFPFNWCKVEPYAGTALQQRYAREGRLRGDYLGHDYTMDDPRARLAYELLLPAFMYRNFDYYGLANLNIGLGYHLQLLKHFYPGRSSADLVRRTHRLIEAINHDTLDLLERTIDFVADDRLGDSRAASLFADRLRRDAFASQNRLADEAEAALRAIEGAAGVRNSPMAGRSEAFTPLQVTAPASARIRIARSSLPRPGRRRVAAIVASAVAASLVFVAPGCSRPPSALRQTSSAGPVSPPGSPPHAAITIAPGQSPAVTQAQSFRLRGVLEPADLQVIGDPRASCKGGTIHAVTATADKHVVEIDYRPSGGEVWNPNSTVSLTWTVRARDSDAVVMAQAFVHANEDGTYALGYQTPRATIAEMAAPPIRSGPNPQGGPGR